MCPTSNDRLPALSLLFFTLWCGWVQAGSGRTRVDQRAFFAAGLNFNLPAGQLGYPAKVNRNYGFEEDLILGGYKYIPSLTYCFRVGYERSVTRNGMHGFFGALGLTDRSRVLKFEDYTIVYGGVTYTRDVDRYEFHDHDTELHLGYRIRFGSLAVRLGAVGLIRSHQVKEIYELDGSRSYRGSMHYWWKSKLWYPMFHVEYSFLSKSKWQLGAFTALDRRSGNDGGEGKWWDVQLGVQMALIKPASKRMPRTPDF